MFQYHTLNLTMSFSASWGTPLKTVTSICVMIALGAPIIRRIVNGTISELNLIVFAKIFLLPCLLIAIVALFSIRGYVLTPNQLIIQRPFWQNKVDLNNIVSAQFDPQAMSNSWRVFGNGGFFSMTGFFWNKKLGFYRVYATDEKHSVILKFKNKVIVVTPDNPQEFLAAMPD